MTETKPKHRWIRFSLRTLLVGMTVLCVWLGFRVNAAHRQKEATGAILGAGGWVGYSHQLVPKAMYSLANGGRFDPPKYGFNYDPIPGPGWLHDLVGDDYFQTVAGVGLNFKSSGAAKGVIEQVAKLPTLKLFRMSVGSNGISSNIEDIDLAALGALDQLESLVIWNVRIDGAALARLRNPAQLTQVCLNNTDSDDAALEQIGKMSNLAYLCLNQLRITDAGLAHLKQLTKLKQLVLWHASITDAGLQHLTGMKQLSELAIHETDVTKDGVIELRKLLSNTNIMAP
jgi:hypothetical protein